MAVTEETEKGDKKARLLEAAKLLFYHQGVHRTTLADIAQEAHVPLGNVYYHFRTKESLIEAVIAAHLQELEANFAVWEQHPDPDHRLRSFIRAGGLMAEQVSLYGCPRGSLCQELGKSDHPLAEQAKALFRSQLEWVEQQFRLLGHSEAAADLAIDLLAAMQGASLLTSSFHTPDLLNRQLARLEDWLTHIAHHA
jgi:TetR/AcrR family transcriptional regulator, transcriptional repressor for nem operon